MKKVFGTRFSLIGDIVMSLPILDYLYEQHGDYYLYFSIAQKCKQSEPIFRNQKYINEIKISDFHESLGANDKSIINNCDIVFDVHPQHPKENDWYNYRNCVEETALMAGLDPNIFKNKKPSLTQYWQDKQFFNKKSIAIWPFAGYGNGLNRSPSVFWWSNTIDMLLKDGFEIFHFGAEIEPSLSKDIKYHKLTDLSFFKQIQYSLCCGYAIGTDSGSMWVIGAYNKIPQINLITNWLPNHNLNKLALAPEGHKVYNMYADGCCDNINQEQILQKINEIIRL